MRKKNSKKLTINSKIFLAGHKGLVGSAILKKLKERGYKQIILKDRKQLNLEDQFKTYSFLKNLKPDAVIVAAAKVGGIFANSTNGAEFINSNLIIQSNIIHGSYIAGVKNLIFLGSSCIYPKFCKQPMKEDNILSGKPETTNEPYAVAKIAGLKLCENYSKQYNLNYLTLMPCNLFGPRDNFDLKTSHFIPALIKKIDNLKNKKKRNLVIWGNGRPKREVLYVDDLADACIYFLNKKTKNKLINIGSNIEFSITEYAKKIMKLLKVKAKIIYKKPKMNGVPRKKLNTKLAKKLGWVSQIGFNDGILKTYDYYLKNEKK